jgi:20S proteasome subunit beta 4
METLFGFVGSDYVLLVCDTAAKRSIVKMLPDDDKILEVDKTKLMGLSGDAGDRVNFSEYIQKNIALYELRNGYPLSVSAAAHYTRNELATALRERPYNVNLLLAGVDKDVGPSLFYMDYLASMHKMNYAVQGYAAYFLFSLFDKYYKIGLNREDGLQLAKLCMKQLQTRFTLSGERYLLKFVDAKGVTQQVITAKDF